MLPLARSLRRNSISRPGGEVDGEVERRAGVEIVEGGQELPIRGTGCRLRGHRPRAGSPGSCRDADRPGGDAQYFFATTVAALKPGPARPVGLVAFVERRRPAAGRRRQAAGRCGGGACGLVNTPRKALCRQNQSTISSVTGIGANSSGSAVVTSSASSVVGRKGGVGVFVTAGDPVVDLGGLADRAVSGAAGVDGDDQPVHSGARVLLGQGGCICWQH